MTLLEMSFSGGIFIIAVAIVRAMAINNLPKKTFLVLWQMVLLRLIVPFVIPSAFSVYSLINRIMDAPSSLETETDNFTSAISEEYFIIIREMGRPIANISSISVWFIIWCTGVVFFAVLFTVSYLRCRVEFQTALPVSNIYADQWIREMRLKRQISIRQSDRIYSIFFYMNMYIYIVLTRL